MFNRMKGYFSYEFKSNGWTKLPDLTDDAVIRDPNEALFFATLIKAK